MNHSDENKSEEQPEPELLSSDNLKAKPKSKRSKKRKDLSEELYQRILEDPNHIAFGIPDGYSHRKMKVIIYLTFFIGLFLVIAPALLLGSPAVENPAFSALVILTMILGICLLCCTGYLSTAYMTDYAIMSSYGVGEENRYWKMNSIAGFPEVRGVTAFEWKDVKRIDLKSKKEQASYFRIKAGNKEVRVSLSYGCRKLTSEDLVKYIPDFLKWVRKPIKGEKGVTTYLRPEITEG